jgi:lipopolysaccharide export system protein LptC
MAGVLLLLAAGLMGLFIFQASGFDPLVDLEPVSEPVAGGKQDAAEQERFAVKGSQVGGFDDESQPYTISAEKARQNKEQPNLVHMQRVSGLLRRSDGRMMDLTAATGLFDSRDKSLRLDGNVSIKLADTFTAHMDTANVDVKRKELTSNADVLVQLTSGQIRSAGIDVRDNGTHVVFKSRVRAVFDEPAPPPRPVAAQADEASTKGNLQQ